MKEINKEKLEELLKNNRKSIVFLHSDELVEEIANLSSIIIDNGHIIIPTSVDVLFKLDSLKMPYRIPEEYHSPKEYVDYMKNKEKEVFDLAKQLDVLIKKYYSEINNYKLNPAFFGAYSFVRMLSPMQDSYFKIKKIINNEKPEVIILLSKDDSESQKHNLEGWLLWGARENLFKKILEQHNFNTSVVLFSRAYERVAVLPSSESFFNKWLRKNRRLHYFLKLFLKEKILALKIIFSQRRLKPLLLLNNGYDWEYCHNDLYQKGYYIWGQINDTLEDWQRDDQKHFENSREIIEYLENNHNFRKLLQENGFDFYQLIKEKLVFFLETIVPASLAAYRETLKIIRKKKVRAVIFSINPTAISKSISFAANKANIPVIGWQHGDLNYEPSDSMVFNDLFLADAFLSWGEGSNNNRRRIAERLSLNAKVETIGSAMIDSIVTKSKEKYEIDKNQPVFSYITTMYYLSNSYVFSDYPYSDNLIYGAQKKIIEGMDKLKGKKIIKLHPNPFYSSANLYQYCRSLKEIEVFQGEISSLEVMKASDIIIVDNPSTTILQAVAFKKPIFCLTCHLAISGKAKDLLSKRAVLSDDPKELIIAVEKFIKSRKYPADINNGEFLEYFGTRSDGKAAERAVAAIDDLIKNNQHD